MLHIITDKNNTLAGVILQQLQDEINVNIINFPKNKKNFIEKAIRYYESKFHLIGSGSSLPKETKESFNKISPDDSVLIFDIDYIRDLQVICKVLPAVKKKSIFLWNPLKTHDGKDWKVKRNLDILGKIFNNISTFDPSDANKYSIDLVAQPFFKIEKVDINKNIDLYFIGSDKGRLNQLIAIKNKAEQEGLICHFHITPSKRIEYSEEEKKHLSFTEISYQENLILASKAKCLVEIVQENQTGPTMRTMEAAFLGCKLLTNRSSAANDIFYHPNNTYIIHGANQIELKSFIDSAPVNFEQEINLTHNIKNWWQQFL